jgi:seryl-tRNA synthetase
VQVELYKELGLHFKVIDMPSGDLGAPAFRKVDIEAWMPGLNRYGEISSASNCTDYQARRLNSRYRVAAKSKDQQEAASGNGQQKRKKGSPTAFCHTLNATACAVPRLIVCIIENYQQEDGTIQIPDALQPYMGGQKVIEKP